MIGNLKLWTIGMPFRSIQADQPYQLDELKFAWCYHVFFRWRTWRRVLVPSLAGLTAESLSPRLEPFQVRLLEFSAEAAKAMDAHWRDQ